MHTASEHWRDRLTVPTYRVGDAARYASTTAQTIGNWQRASDANRLLSPRDGREYLSYLQLIEVGIVSAMRKSGIPIKSIKSARDYLSREFGSEYPFAEYKFKSDGKQLLLDADFIGKAEKGKLISVSESGQFVWRELLEDLLKEFDYPPDHEGAVIRWRVAGKDKPIIIDPRVSFGAPNVHGIATWVLRDRWKSGENLQDIAEDYELPVYDVMEALKFEKIDIDEERGRFWQN